MSVAGALSVNFLAKKKESGVSTTAMYVNGSIFKEASGMDENKVDKLINGANVKTYQYRDIKVTVHTPENVLNRFRQEKINRIYDILSSNSING